MPNNQLHSIFDRVKKHDFQFFNVPSLVSSKNSIQSFIKSRSRITKKNTWTMKPVHWNLVHDKPLGTPLPRDQAACSTRGERARKSSPREKGKREKSRSASERGLGATRVNISHCAGARGNVAAEQWRAEALECKGSTLLGLVCACVYWTFLRVLFFLAHLCL